MRRSFPFALAACGLSVSAAVPAAAQDLQVYGQVRLTVNNVKTGNAGSVTEERDNASAWAFAARRTWATAWPPCSAWRWGSKPTPAPPPRQPFATAMPPCAAAWARWRSGGSTRPTRLDRRCIRR